MLVLTNLDNTTFPHYSWVLNQSFSSFKLLFLFKFAIRVVYWSFLMNNPCYYRINKLMHVTLYSALLWNWYGFVLVISPNSSKRETPKGWRYPKARFRWRLEAVSDPEPPQEWNQSLPPHRFSWADPQCMLRDSGRIQMHFLPWLWSHCSCRNAIWPKTCELIMLHFITKPWPATGNHLW